MEAFLNSRALNASTGEYVLPDVRGPHVAHLKNQSISKLAPFSGLIISIIFVNYFLIKQYVLEGFLLKRVYGKTYTQMTENVRRGFVNHHIAGSTKLVILLLAVYPFVNNAFGSGDFHSRFIGTATIGDALIVAAQMLIAMYVFELFYRPKVSPVSVGHHIGTIMIGQAAIAISLNLVHEKDATIEFTLCTVWGAFDIIAEFLPHVSIILYRVYPNSHRFLSKIFFSAMITTLVGTTAETVVTMWLFGSLWKQWTIAFKITTPMLHLMFMSAQLWGSWNFYKMWQKQQRLIRQKATGFDDGEMGIQAQADETKDEKHVPTTKMEIGERTGSKSSSTESSSTDNSTTVKSSS